LILTLQEKANWLAGRTEMPSWFDRLAPEQARALTVAITGFYKMSGVELVYDQIDECFAPDVPPYELCDVGLEVRNSRDSDETVVYDLRSSPEQTPLVSPTTPSSLPTIDRQRLVFAASPIRWAQWVDLWEREGRRAGSHRPIDGIDRPWQDSIRTSS
jgi:hypothetical protein